MQNVIASSIDNCIIHKASTSFATQDIQYPIPLFYKKVISKPHKHKAILKIVTHISLDSRKHIHMQLCAYIHMCHSYRLCDCYAQLIPKEMCFTTSAKIDMYGLNCLITCTCINSLACENCYIAILNSKILYTPVQVQVYKYKHTYNLCTEWFTLILAQLIM